MAALCGRDVSIGRSSVQNDTKGLRRGSDSHISIIFALSKGYVLVIGQRLAGTELTRRQVDTMKRDT